MGRPQIAIAKKLSLGNGQRSDCEKTVDRMGGIGYDGGHMIAASFKGTSKRFNLVPVATQVNRSIMKTFENAARGCMRNGHKLEDYITTVDCPNARTVIPNKVYMQFHVTDGGGHVGFWVSNVRFPPKSVVTKTK
jgi:hypothetical protein